MSLVYDPCERIWLSINDSGSDNDNGSRSGSDNGSDSDSDSGRDNDSEKIVEESMTVGLHLYFRAVGWGKERGL